MKKTLVELNYKCPSCSNKFIYCNKYDAYACKTCDIWYEDNCGDKDCYFCNKRPEKPSMIKEEKYFGY